MTDLDKMARELLPDHMAGGAGDYPPCSAVLSVEVAREVIRAALLSAPPGYALVPVTMPVEMEVAFCEQWFSKRRAIDDPCMQDCWSASLAAAPEVK
jgi:hypothetical protein